MKRSNILLEKQSRVRCFRSNGKNISTTQSRSMREGLAGMGNAGVERGQRCCLLQTLSWKSGWPECSVCLAQLAAPIGPGPSRLQSIGKGGKSHACRFPEARPGGCSHENSRSQVWTSLLAEDHVGVKH